MLVALATAPFTSRAGGAPEPRCGPHGSIAGDDGALPLRIPFERYRLANGLTVILHEDHTQPMVVVNVGYRVGSRDERTGRTGFAHLFEHLMFMGTTRAPLGKFDEWMELEGAWNNAQTGEDRTVYYAVGPRHTLPLLLWLEADRMSSLGEQITQSKLDTQRNVVRNERRQEIENEPYRTAEELRRAIRRYELDFVERLQPLDARAMVLGSYQAHLGQPDYLAADLARYQCATAESVRAAAHRTLRPDGRVVLRVVPNASQGDAAPTRRREAP